jgi:FkbM family methyltransferase
MQGYLLLNFRPFSDSDVSLSCLIYTVRTVMSSRLSDNVYKFSMILENPTLFRLRREGGLPWTFNKLDTPWFRSLNVDTVLDVGANTGQFTKTISSLLPQARIYAFEPLPDCFKAIEEYASSNHMVKPYNLGLGDNSGTFSFEKNNSSPSSSFLRVNAAHKEAFPYTKSTSKIDVKVERLDNIASSIEFGNSLFIKIDVQGYEDKVIQGGLKTIGKAKIVMLETSFEPLYESQPLFSDIYMMFTELGFSYHGMIDQMYDPNTGKILQGDAIFLK